MKATDFHTTARLPFGELGAVHFIGLGGAGMSAIARILLARGVPVSGSDARDSAVLRQLEALGATVFVGHEAGHIGGADTVVVSTAIRPENPELQAAVAAGLNIVHRSVALSAAMEGKRLIAVGGTHGKTTTTAMATVMLQAAGREPSFAIGGDVAALGVNAAHGEGDLFVAEADESDASFLNYRPQVIVVTNVEADHLDHYGSAEAVYASFDQFAALLPADGTLVVCLDDDGARALAERVAASGAPCRVLGYGYAADAELRIVDSEFAGSGSTSRIEYPGGDCTLRLQVPGEHNIRNAAAAFAVALTQGIEPGRPQPEGWPASPGRPGGSKPRARRPGSGCSMTTPTIPPRCHAALHRRPAGGGRKRRACALPAAPVFPHPGVRRGIRPALWSWPIRPPSWTSIAAREDPIPGVTSELITSRLPSRQLMRRTRPAPWRTSSPAPSPATSC